MKGPASILLAASLGLSPATAGARPVVIGYLPTFKGSLSALLDKVDLGKLTQIDIAFINPASDGAVVRNGALACAVTTQAGPPPSLDDLRAVVTRAHAAGVRVVASLGGAVIPACTGDWKTLLDPALRPTVEANLLKFVHDLDLDGLDIDLEWDVLTRIDQAGDYVPFARELSYALHAKGRILSCATASEPGGMVPKASLPAFDYIGIMSYDRIGLNWGTSGDEHASLDMTRHDLAVWQTQGARKNQMVLGLPFYGYGFGAMTGHKTYADLIAAYGESAADRDVIGTRCAGCDYITYNGRPTIRAKVAMARKAAAGVMIWDLTGDAPTPDSLLDVVAQSLDARTSVPANPRSKISRQ